MKIFYIFSTTVVSLNYKDDDGAQAKEGSRVVTVLQTGELRKEEAN